MSLDKAIASGKEHRKPYRGAKAVDPSCRNHGDDDWAKNNRLYSSRKRKESSDAKLKEATDFICGGDTATGERKSFFYRFKNCSFSLRHSRTFFIPSVKLESAVSFVSR